MYKESYKQQTSYTLKILFPTTGQRSPEESEKEERRQKLRIIERKRQTWNTNKYNRTQKELSQATDSGSENKITITITTTGTNIIETEPTINMTNKKKEQTIR